MFFIKTSKTWEISTIPREGGTYITWLDPESKIKQNELEQGVKSNCKLFHSLVFYRYAHQRHSLKEMLKA